MIAEIEIYFDNVKTQVEKALSWLETVLIVFLGSYLAEIISWSFVIISLDLFFCLVYAKLSPLKVPRLELMCVLIVYFGIIVYLILGIIIVWLSIQGVQKRLM